MSTAAPPATPPRFSWPMRIFLFILLFDIIFRSFTVLIPWADWATALDLRFMPRRLPTRCEWHTLPQGDLGEELAQVRRSMLDYWTPWPSRETRERINGPIDCTKWTVCWLSTRLDFVENLIGFNQEWPMFSPSVGRRKWVTRARLTYADQSQVVIRNHGDPPDLTRYAHWNEEKVLDHELKVTDSKSSRDDCFAYCNLLTHRHAHNEVGSPLVNIRLYEVKINFAPPGVDYRAFYQDQMSRTDEDNPAELAERERQVSEDFYEYYPADGKGRRLKND